MSEPVEHVLNKGTEQFVFRYQPGQESLVLDQLAELAQRPDSGFDWFDAAVISHMVGQRLAKTLEPFKKEGTK